MRAIITIIALCTAVAASGQIYIDSYRFAPATPAGLLLDEYPGAAAAYSLRKLRTAYTGDAIMVRRSSDGDSLNIGFSGNYLDTAALKTFCASTDCFVRTWYDQSTNIRNVAKTTTDNQPIIISSGALLYEKGYPIIQFDGANDNLTATGFATILNVDSNFTVINVLRAWAIAPVFIYTCSPNSANRVNQITANLRFSLNTGGVLTGRQVTINTTDTYLSFMTNAPQELYVNNVQGTSLGGTNAYNSATLSIGATPANTAGAAINLHEFIIYASNQSANQSGIESNINSFYNIY
jgi:hypothetical protein